MNTLKIVRLMGEPRGTSLAITAQLVELYSAHFVQSMVKTAVFGVQFLPEFYL